MSKYMRFTEDKTRFINQLPWKSEEEKQKVLDFFKSHANLKTYIPSGNPEIDSKLDKLGAKSVQSLTESSTQKYWRDCLEGMMYF